MGTKLTKARYLSLIGWYRKKAVRIKHTVCFRKPMNLATTQRLMAKHKHAIGIVSAHNVYRKPNTPYAKMWCHCFQKPRKYFPKKPLLLLSESDFVDPVGTRKLVRCKKWDFFYFTIGGPLGAEYKGIDVFANSLPALCGEYGMKGVIVQYAHCKLPLRLNKRQRKLFNKYSSNLHVVRRSFKPGGVANIMAKSRFGFFPNKQDCSPLLITESLVRNIPVLINSDILGGWKYANEGTGSLFDSSNIEEKLDFMRSHDFNPREKYMEDYGYKNSSTRLAEFCKEHLKGFHKYSMVGFGGSEHVMRYYRK